eukprot:Gb_20386 [translate_table: standard]
MHLNPLMGPLRMSQFGLLVAPQFLEVIQHDLGVWVKIVLSFEDGRTLQVVVVANISSSVTYFTGQEGLGRSRNPPVRRSNQHLVPRIQPVADLNCSSNSISLLANTCDSNEIGSSYCWRSRETSVFRRATLASTSRGRGGISFGASTFYLNKCTWDQRSFETSAANVDCSSKEMAGGGTITNEESREGLPSKRF